MPTPPPAASAPTKEAPRVERPKRNSHVPLPFSDKTTNPSLDAARSTVVPDREALPQEFQDLPLAPLGPAPPDVTETQYQYGSGPKRVQNIHGGEAKPAPSATPPAAPAPDPRRTP